ncbi:MAG: ABC transporter permease, partial [Acidobacteriota bacterium]
LTGAGLLARTYVELQRVDPGFDSESVLTFQLSLPAERYPTPLDVAELTRQLDGHLGALPAVSAAGAINQLPLANQPNWSTPWKTRQTTDAAESREADARVVTPGYLRAVAARLLEGRLFEASDDENARRVVIVDELLARQAWPDAPALGQEIEVRLWSGRGFEPVWAQVIGVVSHVRHHQLSQEVRGQIFAPFAQGPRNQVGVAVRTAIDPLRVVGPVRQQLAAIDPDLALADVRILADTIASAQGGPRFRMALAGVVAALALVLACFGLYSVLALAVASRRHEIGVRLAIGGTPGDIVRLFLAHGLRWVLGGAAAGVLASLAVNRWLESLLYGVATNDARTLLSVPPVLMLLALAACYLPARRASQIDPLSTLRCD